MTLDNDSTPAAPGTSGAPSAPDSAIKIDEIRRSIRELEAMHRRKQDAAEAYADSIKAVAKNAGISPQVLARYVAARVKEKAPQEHARTAQLALLFEEV